MNLDFDSLIVAEASILTSDKSDRLKLGSLGGIYYDCSQGILARSEELLNLATRSNDESEKFRGSDFIFSRTKAIAKS